ncbi:MAG TPA: histidine kinase dimerization/phospho-acceptor domain-containing protein, partial [Actinomycetota bacterium]|nr:histidine kinase dimerization/phospho-acceptor domain-containing protein [Actinomycetota bacterium]
MLRAAGYLLLLFAAVMPIGMEGAGAFLALPAGAIVPASVGLVAGAMSGWRRRGERGGVWLGAGVMLLAIGDSMLVVDRPWVLGLSHAVRSAGYLAVGWFAYAATRHSIRFRMVTGFVALLLAVVLAMSSAVAQVIATNLRESAIASVSQQGANAETEMVSRAGTIQGNVGVLTEALVDNLRENSIGDGVARAMQRLLDLDFVAIYDASGRLLDVFGMRAGQAVALSGGTVVGGAPETVTFETVGPRIALIGAQTVEDGGQALGVIVGGDFVDSDLLARMLPVGTPGAIYSMNETLLASTFPETSVALLPRADVARITERALRIDVFPLETLTIGGQQYFAAAVTLMQEPITPIATLVVAQPAAVVAETQRGVTRVIFLVALGAAALALLLALLVSRRITRPVVALTTAATRVQGGDLGVRAETRGEDEVADLGRAFNSMTASVTTMTEELRDAAEEQARLRARLETVLNSMGDGLIAVNDAGRVVTYNPAAGTILGLPRSRVVGRPVKDVLRGRTADGRPILAGRGATNGLAFVRRQSGDDIPVAITSSPLRDGDGASVGRVYVLRDMTREHQVERMKSEFLSNVSHELRTPLTPIIGYSELLARRGAQPGQAKEFAGGILESAKRLERVVAMLVDFSALEAGRMALSTERVQLGPIIKGVVDAWKGRSERHRFTTKTPRRLPAVDVDFSL